MDSPLRLFEKTTHTVVDYQFCSIILLSSSATDVVIWLSYSASYLAYKTSHDLYFLDYTKATAVFDPVNQLTLTLEFTPHTASTALSSVTTSSRRASTNIAVFPLPPPYPHRFLRAIWKFRSQTLHLLALSTLASRQLRRGGWIAVLTYMGMKSDSTEQRRTDSACLRQCGELTNREVSQ